MSSKVFLEGIALLLITLLGVAAYGVLNRSGEESALLKGFDDPFLSIQLAADPQNGDCLTTDGTDNAWGDCGVGGGSIDGTGTSSQLAYFTDSNSLLSVATGTLTTNATGLSLDQTRGLVGGAAVLSLDSGYAIPSTTRLSNHDTAFSWGNHASQGYLTGNETITLSGDVSGSGETSITATVSDDSHDHTTLTISGLDISDDTNLSADGTEIILTGDALSLGETLTFTTGTLTGLTATNATTTNATSTAFFSSLGTFTNLFGTAANFTYASTTGLSGTNLSFTNATATTARVTTLFAGDYPVTATSSPSFILASTTANADGKSFSTATTTWTVKNYPQAVTLLSWYCTASSTGSVSVRFGDASGNWTNDAPCSTTGAVRLATQNNTFTAFEPMQVQVGSASSDPSYVYLTFNVVSTVP